MRLTGRSEEQLALTEAYAKEQGFWLDTAAADPLVTDALEVDMGTVQPSLAGPKRAQDKVVLSQVDEVLNSDLTSAYKKALPERVQVARRSHDIGAGDVVIAAIKSGPNNSQQSEQE